MKKYHPLQIFKYENNNNDVRVEYSNRVEGPTTIVSNLYINPEISGQRQGEKYPLFLMPIKDVLKLESTIHENSKIIENLTNELPGIASDQFFYKTLTEEIMSTNEIEGVETLNKEIIEAINGAENRSKKKIRLKSFARMYLGIRDRENIQINMLEDIRKIYDYLLDGEVAKSELPDGILFRNKFARVGTPDETVHQPKNTEQEISLDLKDWISFINNDDTPAILKCFIAHYYFENIHPFNDGNGRTGRYIACVYLGYKLDPLSAITFSSEVNKNKEKYYKAFKDVSNPNNFGEVTFFVLEMMKIFIKGQKYLISEMSKNKQLLDFMKNKIDKDDSLSGLSKRILYLYIQAFLFNDSGLGLEDRELKKYTTKDIEITESKVNKFPWTKVRACIDELEEQGVLIKTQKSPLTRKLSSDYISNVIISDEQ